MKIFIVFFIITLVFCIIFGYKGKSGKHPFILFALIFGLIYNLFMGVCDATGATDKERNKMRGKSD